MNLASPNLAGIVARPKKDARARCSVTCLTLEAELRRLSPKTDASVWLAGLRRPSWSNQLLPGLKSTCVTIVTAGDKPVG